MCQLSLYAEYCALFLSDIDHFDSKKRNYFISDLIKKDKNHAAESGRLQQSAKIRWAHHSSCREGQCYSCRSEGSHTERNPRPNGNTVHTICRSEKLSKFSVDSEFQRQFFRTIKN